MTKAAILIEIVIDVLKLTKLLFLVFGLSNILNANSVSFTFKEGHNIKLGEVFEITWESDLSSDATVDLSYSYSGSVWYDIEKVEVGEESYFWIIPEDIYVNDGMISIRIMSGYSTDYTKLKVKGFAKKVAKSNSYQSSAPKKASSNKSSDSDDEILSDCFWGCIVPYYLLVFLFG